MARIHTILQGFVDLNLELDENVNTTIDTENQPGALIPDVDLQAPIDLGGLGGGGQSNEDDDTPDVNLLPSFNIDLLGTNFNNDSDDDSDDDSGFTLIDTILGVDR